MATGKPQLLFVHGIGGLRDTATDRDRWLQALAAGARDAGMVDAISGLTQGRLADVTFANYSDLFNRRGAQGDPARELDEHEVPFWARTLMRTDPSGCEAVLVPATGRPPLRRRRPGPTSPPASAPADDQVRARAETFADDRESPAVRLAIAASPLASFTLPVLDVLRDRLVPDAALADTAEFLTAGLLTATRSESADMIYQFHPAAAAHLTTLLTRDQLWDTP